MLYSFNHISDLILLFKESALHCADYASLNFYIICVFRNVLGILFGVPLAWVAFVQLKNKITFSSRFLYVCQFQPCKVISVTIKLRKHILKMFLLNYIVVFLSIDANILSADD